MLPSDCYQKDLQQKNFTKYTYQAIAVDHLQRLYLALEKKALENNPSKKERSAPSFLGRLFSKEKQKAASIKGLYFYGGVGRGKTYLMDLFYHSLQTKRKSRLHFHYFMLKVHTELQNLAGKKNPLLLIVEQFVKRGGYHLL